MRLDRLQAQEDARPKPGGRLKLVGAILIALSLACLGVGWLVVRSYFPNLMTNGFTPTALSVLVPISSLGVIGIALLLVGWVRESFYS